MRLCGHLLAVDGWALVVRRVGPPVGSQLVTLSKNQRRGSAGCGGWSRMVLPPFGDIPPGGHIDPGARFGQIRQYPKGNQDIGAQTARFGRKGEGERPSTAGRLQFPARPRRGARPASSAPPQMGAGRGMAALVPVRIGGVPITRRKRGVGVAGVPPFCRANRVDIPACRWTTRGSSIGTDHAGSTPSRSSPPSTSAFRRPRRPQGSDSSSCGSVTLDGQARPGGQARTGPVQGSSLHLLAPQHQEWMWP